MWGESGLRPEPSHKFDELFASESAIKSIRVSCTPDDAWELISHIERLRGAMRQTLATMKSVLERDATRAALNRID